MKTIVPIVSAVVLALALMSASAAPTQHERHTKAAAATQPQILVPSSAACRFRAAAIPRWAIRRAEHQPVLMWRYVRTTRFMETTANRNAAAIHVRF